MSNFKILSSLLILCFILSNFDMNGQKLMEKLQGKYTIENQMMDSQYPTVGYIELYEGTYQFIPDKKYELENFKSEFYSDNPSGIYKATFKVETLENLEDHEILCTLDFTSNNNNKHSIYLRFNAVKNEIYFHSLISKFELFKIIKPFDK